MIINFIKNGSQFTMEVDGATYGVWPRVEQVDGIYSIDVSDKAVIMSLKNPYLSFIISEADTVSINGVNQAGTIRQVGELLKDNVFYSGLIR